MISHPPFRIDRPDLQVVCSLAPWDSGVFGVPVGQISHIRVGDPRNALRAFGALRDWITASDIRILSCRLPQDALRESILLEDFGFRFVEMVLHPYLTQLQRLAAPDTALDIAPAQPSDLPEIAEIAGTAFRHERYHVDPRIDSNLADLRYVRWVRNAVQHPRQRLFKLSDGDRLVAFFIVEIESRRAYWHLTAVAPRWQGQGYGIQAWSAMLATHRDAGLTEVSTTIAARNTRVLGLYGKLGFRFLPPEMTFHWMRAD